MTPPAAPSPLDLLTPAAFRAPRHFALSAWTGHLPFAFWVVDVLRPRRIVELGTYHGFSFLGFCQAMAESAVAGEVIGVDTWQGDAHATENQHGVLARLQAEVSGQYPGLARLLPMTFDEALAEVPDGSVDLLHIDGFHTYEAVRHDFETWRGKLAPGAVVLFHDTAVQERGFGVHRFWAEVSEGRPHFAFAHQYGLGVLGWGEPLPPPLAALFACADDEAAAIRLAFERLGHAVVLEADAHALRKDRMVQATIRLRHIARRIAWRLRGRP